MQKRSVENKIIEYLKLKNIKVTQKGPTTIIDCPICKSEKMCVKIPNVYKFNCHNCKKSYDIFDFAKKIESNFPETEQEQIHYLKELLNIDIVTSIDEKNIDELLKFYESIGWDLLPVARSSKVPFQGNDWTTKEHKDIKEWKRWLDDGLNIGVKTGRLSNLLTIDLDVLIKSEKDEIRDGKATKEREQEILAKRKKNLEIIYKEIKDIMGEPLIHETLGGSHLMYKYDEEIPKTFIKIKDFHVDVESEGGYILIAPSKLKNDKFRKFKEFKDTPKIPIKFKKFLISKMNVSDKKSLGSDIQEAIDKENFKIDPKDLQLINNGLEGCCNSSFTKLGGIFRKQLNIKQTGYVLHTLNKHLLEKPMTPKAINVMIHQLDKYCHFDETALANDIIEYLKRVKESSRTEIAMSLVGTNRGEDKKRVDFVLSYLVEQEKITHVGKNNYSILNGLEWSGKLLNIGVPVRFKVPFFDSLFNFNYEDLILVASRTKYGKTTLAMNFVKRFLDQGIKVDYIYNETGGRFAKTALKLGMKDDDFDSAFATDPFKAILRKDKVTIFDWVKPMDFARTDNVYSNLVEKVKKSNGFLICFAQLRQNDTFFAPDQIGQFPSLISRYMYDDDSGENTKFVIDDARDAKTKGKKWEIPCRYDWDTRLVHTIEEIQEEENENN